MFVVKHDKLYFHDKGRIILFETPQEAETFVNGFIQYSTNRLAQEGRMGEAMQAPIIIMSQCKILPMDFGIDDITCGTVLMKELFSEYGV